LYETCTSISRDYISITLSFSVQSTYFYLIMKTFGNWHSDFVFLNREYRGANHGNQWRVMGGRAYTLTSLCGKV
jgi:hypothetical protein